MDKLSMATPDLTSENIKKVSNFLKSIFPECVKESEDEDGNLVEKIDFDLLKAELGNETVEGLTERYRLDWPGKQRSILKANTPITKTLRPVKEDSVDWDTTGNLYIEGDNFEALKILQESYLGKVKMIYIDPPYNTGNDFVYNDDFTEDSEEYKEKTEQNSEGYKMFRNTESNGRFHSDWLSMMYERLKVARDLLSDDGSIIISIDDNEVDNLRKMCNEIFGESNFIANIVLENDSRARPYNSIATTHEYILVYTKTSDADTNILVDPNKEFNYYDDEGGYDLYELRNRNVSFNKDNRPNLYYPFYLNEKNCNKDGLYEISLENKDGWTEVYPQESNGIKTVWRRGKDKAAQNLNTVLFGRKSNTGHWQVVKKYRENTYVLNSVWTDKEFKSDRGTLELKKLFNNKKYFDFPKPVDLIKRFLELFVTGDDIVLDFFSGSGTTAHAVMEYNAIRKGNNKYILVQLPESIDNEFGTISNFAIERIRRAAKKIKEETGADIDYGFRVYKVDESCMKDVYYHPKEIKQDGLDLFVSNIKEDRTSEDLLTQIILNLGLTLDLPIEEKSINGNQVFYVAGNSLVACFDKGININTIEEIAKDQPIKLVFCDSSFKSDEDRLNVENKVRRISPETKISVI